MSESQASRGGVQARATPLNAVRQVAPRSSMLDSITLRRSVWLSAIALVIHEVEEWNIAAWFSEHFYNAPGMSQSAVGLGLVAVSSMAVLWAWVATRFRKDVLCAAVALPLVVGVGAGNALQHVSWLLLFDAYAPGVVTAICLLLPAAILFALRIPRTAPILVACAVLVMVIVTGAVETYAAGPELQPHEVAFQQKFIDLAGVLGL